MGVFSDEITRELNETIQLNERVAMSMKRQIEVIEDLELLYVERPMKITELAEIIGITRHGINKWDDPNIKSGVLFSYFYGYVKAHKPEYLPKLKEYINRTVRYDRGSLRHRLIKK